MLVLTRKAQQKIRIGNDIYITVLKVQGDQVSIGIEAPKELQIVREELLSEEVADRAARLNKENAIKLKNSLKEGEHPTQIVEPIL